MATSVGSTNLTTASAWQLLEAINPDPSQSSTMAVYLNGALQASGVAQAGTTPVTASLYINGQGGTSTNSFQSYVAEILVFNTGLSETNRRLVEGYLAWKWGIQGLLPNTHPYYSATPSAGVTTAGNLTVDAVGNIQVAPNSNFRILGPTEWRANMTTVSGTSLTIPTPTVGAPTTNSAGLYTITNTGFNALTLPTYTAASPGVFWTLANSTASNLSIGVTYTSGSGLGSTLVLNAGSSANIYWNGTAFTSISGQGPTGATGFTGPSVTGPTGPGTSITLTGISTEGGVLTATGLAGGQTGLFMNNNLTFDGTTLTVVGSTTARTIIPSANNTYNLGSASAGYSFVYGGTFSGNASGLTGTPNITVGTISNGSATSNNIGGTTLSNTIVTVGAATTGAVTSGSVNVSGGFFINGVAFTGGGGGGTISNYYSNGAVLFATGTTTGLQGSSNLFYNTTSNFLGIQTTTPATALDVNGGVTIRNGLRPLYSNVSSGTSLAVAANAYGFHFNITTTSLNAITIPTVVPATDSNAYWVFRNNTGNYLSITFTYTTAGTTFPTNPVVIPPANSTTLMVTYPGSVLGYVLF